MSKCQSSNFSMNPKLILPRLGCFDCLLSMKPGCKCPVKVIRKYGDPYLIRIPRGLRLAWIGKVEYGDHSVVEWVFQRALLLKEFLGKFARWSTEYQRETSCGNKGTGMEITEHGVSSGSFLDDFTELY